METTLKTPTKSLQLEPLTEEQIRSMNRGYNAKAWDAVIDRFNKYKDVEYYYIKADEHFSYERYYAVYTIPEGIRLFNQVSYGGMMSSNGFSKVYIPDMQLDNLYDAYGVYVSKFRDADGNEGRLENCKQNREYMAKMSEKWGDVFTNIL